MDCNQDLGCFRIFEGCKSKATLISVQLIDELKCIGEDLDPKHLERKRRASDKLLGHSDRKTARIGQHYHDQSGFGAPPDASDCGSEHEDYEDLEYNGQGGLNDEILLPDCNPRSSRPSVVTSWGNPR